MNNSVVAAAAVAVATTTIGGGSGSGSGSSSSGNGGGGGGGGVLHDFVAFCRNLTNANVNGTKSGTSTKSAEDTDFGAVLYIVVVLTFYSFGIVIMIVKYLKTEKKEMEEEMVLDSFFKGIPDKRIEIEKQAVNRVAIQAFHTLTTSKRPRGVPQSSQDSNNERYPADAAPQHKKLLSPATYRRERYSIQPMYIGTSRQIDDGDLSDIEDENGDDNQINNTHKTGRRRRGGHCTLDNENELVASNPRIHQHKNKAESKPNKSVLFSDAVESVGGQTSCDFVENGGVRSKRKGMNSGAPSRFSQQSLSDCADGFGASACRIPMTDIHQPFGKSPTEGNSSDTEIGPGNASSRTADDMTCVYNTKNSSTENVPLNVLSSPRIKSSKNAGKGFVSTRKPSKGVLMKQSQDSPDLGLERSLFRIASLEKGIGDGSSYDSSSSLLTRIHLAEPFTPPLATKNAQNTPKPSSSGDRISNCGGNTGADCSPNIKYPSNFDTVHSGNGKADDERMKLTAGKNVPSMQPSYDSTASSKGLTTRVNIVDSSTNRDGGSKSCLVTDL